jgi:hypothetical protein
MLRRPQQQMAKFMNGFVQKRFQYPSLYGLSFAQRQLICEEAQGGLARMRKQSARLNSPGRARTPNASSKKAGNREPDDPPARRGRSSVKTRRGTRGDDSQ